mgnify:CR=1 FL=1|tara:strand:- start:2137 stop:2952 length:816 start_codon:yes stop_codon:yes gene_type:complete
MTTQFDYLLEQFLGSLNEAPIAGDAEEIAKEISSKAKASPMTGHWKLLKKQENADQVALDIIKLVLPTKKNSEDKDNTYNPDIDTAEDLKKAINSAVEKTTSKGGWAAKFLTDRMSTIAVKNVVFDLVKDAISTKQPVTQKQAKEKIKQYLETKPQEEIESNTVYFKSADVPEETELVKAFSKLPDDKDMTKQEVMEIVQNEEAVNELIRSGALISKEAEPEEPEQEEGEGTGEVTSGVDLSDTEDFDSFDDVYNALGDDTSKRVGGHFND